MLALKRICLTSRLFIQKNLSSTTVINNSESGCNKGQEKAKKTTKSKTPVGKLEEVEGSHPYQEKEPLPAHPGGVNPVTGEVGGPRGPEPTRYGDWERKGRVTDF